MTSYSTVHDSEARVLMRYTIRASSDGLLLPRILQKFAVPDVTLVTVRFDRAAESRVALTACLPPARGRLIAERVRKLIAVREVTLRKLPDQLARPLPRTLE